MDNIFDKLNNLSKIDLYDSNKKSETDSTKKSHVVKVENIYDKTITCPVCKKESKIKMAKKFAAKIDKKDTDFMIYYSGVNLLFYEITYCPECGYAALSNYFNRLQSRQIDLIKKNISVNWTKKNFGEIKDVDTAIQLFKLALLNTVVKDGKASEKALLCLKLSWLYRLKGDKENEKDCQQKALDGFNIAYENEYFPIAGLDKWNLIYLLGELNRRIGNNSEALRCFSEILISPDVKSNLKDRVRDLKDMINSEK